MTARTPVASLIGMVNSDIRYAPWEPAEVIALNTYQHLGIFHEYTCEHGHGPLAAYSDGWHCTRGDCTYHQTWAYAWTIQAAMP